MSNIFSISDAQPMNIAFVDQQQQPILQTPSPQQPFKHRSTKIRSLKKAESALPKSPSKRKEIVKKLATSELRWKFQSRRGRKKNDLNEEQREWLLEFLDRPDISTQTPGRKDHVYCGKENGEKKFLQKRYLSWTIRELLEIANGHPLVPSDEANFFDAFGCKLTFRQLYELMSQVATLIFQMSLTLKNRAGAVMKEKMAANGCSAQLAINGSIRIVFRPNFCGHIFVILLFQ